MKTTWKWIPVLAFAAAAAHAQADFPCGAPDGEFPPPPPCVAEGCGRMPPPPMCGPHGRPGMPPPDCAGPTEEQRAEFAAFRHLCQAVRAESDEAKKAELAEELRAKLAQMAEGQSARQKERLADAEKRIAEQKARLDAQVEALRGRIEDEEAHRSEWIEEQLRCILSGERPPMRHIHRGPECKGPEGRCGDRPGPWHGKKKSGHCGGKRGMPPCGEAGALPPPPPEGAEGGAMPPPDGEMAE